MTHDFQQFGKLLIFAGIYIVVLGIVLLFGDKIPLIGKLPGDIIIKKKNFTLYIPIVTSLILSLLISLLLFLFRNR
jgi:Protein of unknown function (DUF2905)